MTTAKNIEQVTIKGNELTLEELIAVARHRAVVKLTDDPKVWKRFDDSCAYINRVAERGEPVYGVLQIWGNSIMPLIAHLGNSLADRFPTHAEQFNQNINSMGFGSANLAREAVRLCQRYLAIALICGVQAADLRTFLREKHYDARSCLSPATLPLYEAARAVTGRLPSREKPFIRNDDDQPMDAFIELLAKDIAGEGGGFRVYCPLNAAVTRSHSLRLRRESDAPH